MDETFGDGAPRQLDDGEDRTGARAELEAFRRRSGERDELRRIEAARRDPAARRGADRRSQASPRAGRRRRAIRPRRAPGRSPSRRPARRPRGSGRPCSAAVRLWAGSTPTYQSRRKTRRPASPGRRKESARPGCTGMSDTTHTPVPLPSTSSGSATGRRRASPRLERYLATQAAFAAFLGARGRPRLESWRRRRRRADAVLVRRLRERDRTAWEELYAEYGPRLRGVRLPADRQPARRGRPRPGDVRPRAAAARPARPGHRRARAVPVHDAAQPLPQVGRARPPRRARRRGAGARRAGADRGRPGAQHAPAPPAGGGARSRTRSWRLASGSCSRCASSRTRATPRSAWSSA